MSTTYRIADDVAWVSREDLDHSSAPAAYAVLLPDGRPLTFEGSACLVWLALADGGTLEEVTATAAEMADAAPAEITDDVRVLIERLLAAGLLREQ